MKNSSIARTFTLLTLAVNVAFAQNPKTNAGRIDGNSGLPPSPAIQQQKAQSPAKPDYTNYKRDTSSRQNVQPASQDDQPKTASVANTDSNKGLISFGLLVGLTQNQFQEVSNSDWGIGLGITVMGNIMGTDAKEKSPVNIYIGGSFEYLYFGGKSSSYSYNDPYPYNPIKNNVTTSVNSNIYSLLLVSRVEFFNGPVVPFIEGAVGGRLFDGKEKVSVARTQEPGSILPSGITFTPTTTDFSDNLQSDIVGTIGYGGGVRIGSPKLRVELKLMYMPGSKGKYIDNTSIQFDKGSNKFTYTTTTSSTDLLLPQISVSANF